MPTRSLSALSLTNQQLQSFAVDNLSADPTGAGLYQGRLWWNTTSKLLKYYDGTAVQVVAAQAFANPMTTQYDLIQGGASGVPTRLAKGANNTVLAVDGSGVGSYRTLVTADLAANAVTQNGTVSTGAADSTTSSTAVDMAGLSVTLTTVGGPLLVLFVGPHSNSTVNALDVFYTKLDSNAAAQGPTYQQLVASATHVAVISRLLTGVAAGSHTVKIQWSTNAGTLSQAGVRDLIVVELKR